MSDEQFYLGVVRAIVLGAVGVIAVIGGCCSNTNYQISQALQAKVDPLQVACAFGNGGQSDCTVLAAKR